MNVIFRVNEEKHPLIAQMLSNPQTVGFDRKTDLIMAALYKLADKDRLVEKPEEKMPKEKNKASKSSENEKQKKIIEETIEDEENSELEDPLDEEAENISLFDEIYGS